MMIKVSVMYANEDGKSFDMDYYCNSHFPMVMEKIGAACLRTEIDQGLAGGAPDAPAAFVAMGHLYFESVDSFQAAFGPHAETSMADVPNYTDIAPNIQISEIKE